MTNLNRVTLTLSDAELEQLKRAVEVHHDINDDMLLDNISFTFIRENDEPQIVDHKKSAELRKEISAAFDRMYAVKSLLEKVKAL